MNILSTSETKSDAQNSKRFIREPEETIILNVLPVNTRRCHFLSNKGTKRPKFGTKGEILKNIYEFESIKYF